MDTLFRFPDINGPFRGSHAPSEGWLTTRQLRSTLLTRLFRDVYVPKGLEVTHRVRCQAAALIAPPGAVLTGLSAAALRGVDLCSGDHPVELIVPRNSKFTAQRGLNVRRMPVADDEHEPWGPIGIATPVRLTFDVLANTRLRKSLPRTVGRLDALLRAELVDWAQLVAVLGERHDHGIVRARRAAELADPRSESIPESEVRVWLTLGGLPPDVQVTVYDPDGRFLGRLDLAYLRYKLAVEYDGEWHDEEDQRREDELRRRRLMAAGWSFVVVAKDQLYGDPAGMVALVRDTLRRRASGKMPA